jgi:hypothetical protein
LLAHQGGWDELWLPLALLILIIGLVVRSLRHRGKNGAGSGKEGYCLYCGSELADGVERCERCGFKKENR